MKMAGRGQVECLLAISLLVIVAISGSTAEKHSNDSLRSSYHKSVGRGSYEPPSKCKVIYDFKELEFEDKQKSSNYSELLLLWTMLLFGTIFDCQS